MKLLAHTCWQMLPLMHPWGCQHTVPACVQWGRTPLQFAAREDHVEAMKALIASGAVVDAADQVHEACMPS